MSDSPSSLESFIVQWQTSGAAERANYQLFLTELCDLLGVDKPHPTQADVTQNAYVIERDVTFHNQDGIRPWAASISTSGAASCWKRSRVARPRWKRSRFSAPRRRS